MMLALAQAHANAVYHEWGLVAVVVVIFATLMPLLWWLLRMKTEDTTVAALRIQSALASLFQRTVLDEVEKVFLLIEDRLPVSLSQADDVGAEPSAFDRLCVALRGLDLEDPDRQQYARILEDELADSIATEVKKLLMITKASSVVRPGGRASPRALPMSFEQDTERKLAFMATKTVEVKRKVRRFWAAKRWAFGLFGVCAIAALLSALAVLVDHQLAFRVWVALVGLLVASGLGAVASLIVFHACQSWLGETGQRSQSSDAWQHELALWGGGGWPAA